MSYAWLAAGTESFTAPAEALTAGAFAAVGAVAVTLRWREGSLVRADERTGRSGSVTAWIVVLGALLVWELVTYLEQNRSVFPTLSSLYDEMATARPGKAAVFLAWLILGYVLFAT